MAKQRNAGEKSFAKDVLESKNPVLVDFYADWCAPCRSMAPIIEELSHQFAGKFDVVKINIEDYMEIAEQYNITSIPTFMVFNKGREVKQMVGAVQKQDLEQIMEDALSTI